MEEKRLIELIDKFKTNTATDAEIQELDMYYQGFEKKPGYTDVLSENQMETYKEMIFERIDARINQLPLLKKSFYYKLSIAATIFVILSAGLFYYINQRRTVNQAAVAYKNEIVPGGNKAVLTLADGSKITLSDAANGNIANQSGVNITKTAAGQLIYSGSSTEVNSSKVNRINTPKGGQWQVHLPDGSIVWLNAASSLIYPTSFKGQKERRVELTGEAYFEIAKDKAHPFLVATAKQEVRVLGTHFNINSYEDEASTKTTLLEGAVRLNGGVILKPGDQASLLSSGKFEVKQTDVDEAIAWKNGKFIFDDENIESIMRKLARWYDVEVVYKGNFEGKTFGGSISRYDSISKILDKITFTQAVQFKIEGRRITVMP